MKKLYFIFALLLSLFGTAAFAQTEVTIPVDMDHGKWVAWNNNESTPYASVWFSTTTPAISLCCTNGSNDISDIRGNSFTGANNMTSWGNPKTLLSIFNQFGSTGYGNYEIMVEIGWFIKSVEFDFNSSVTAGTGVSLMGGEEVVSAGPDDTQHISWEAEDEETYAVPFIVYQKGTNGFAQTSNFYVVVGKLPEAVTALQELQSTLETYDGYVGALTPGTQPGQYDAEKVAAFESIVAQAHESEDNPDLSSMSDEELAAFYRSLAEQIVAAYEAVIASKVPMTLADGYYRIKSGMEFYTTETIVDPETQEEKTVTTYHDKYLSTQTNGETISAVWNTPDDVESYCPALFQVTNKNGAFDIVSMATGGRFNEDKPVTLTVNSDNLMALDAVATNEEGVSYVNIRQATTEAYSGAIYLHCSGHGSGTGVSGTLTLYYPNESGSRQHASEWIFVPVSDEDAKAIIEAYEPIKEQEMLVYNFTTTMADAQEKLEIARDRVLTPTEEALITDAAQFSSPCSDRVEGTDFGLLLDGDGSTIWHGDWHGDYTGSVQYFQVEIQDADAQAASMWFQRRNTTSNQITQWTVYGVDDPEAEIGAGERLAVLNTAYSAAAEQITTDPFPFNGHKIIRFYFTGNTNSSAKYAHLAEFQLYKADVSQSSTAQCFILGDTFTNLESLVKSLMGVESEDITLEQYRELKAAYDAFIAKFVDPAALREVLDNQKTAIEGIVIGTDPGFWTANEGAGAFRSLYEEAVAYDAAGAYTAEKSEEYIEKLNQGAEDIYSSANKVQEGKWYRIRFANEEEFEKYGWDTVAGDGQFNENINAFTSQPLFGKYVTVSRLSQEAATYTNEDGEEAKVTVYETEERPEAETLGYGDRLMLDDKEDIAAGEGLDLFRFVAVGDSAYILQNKGTNLFLKAAGTSGGVTLSAHPSLFNVRAIGFGENVLAAKSITGDNQNYLHGQVAANLLVTWDADYPGSRSGLYIEEAEDVAGDYEGVEFNMPIVYGALNAFCFPVEISVNEGQMWTVNSFDAATNSITLAKIEKAVGGRPFLYINGEPEDFVAPEEGQEEEVEMVSFNLGFSVDGVEPQTDNALKGTYSSIVLDRGDVYCKDNKLVVNTVEKDAIMVTLTRVAANGAYITAESKFDPTAEVTITWSEEADGVEQALANVSKNGAIYTIDGKLVSKSGNLNDATRFGKGIYILNGTKIVVK